MDKIIKEIEDMSRMDSSFFLFLYASYQQCGTVRHLHAFLERKGIFL